MTGRAAVASSQGSPAEGAVHDSGLKYSETASFLGNDPAGSTVFAICAGREEQRCENGESGFVTTRNGNINLSKQRILNRHRECVTQTTSGLASCYILGNWYFCRGRTGIVGQGTIIDPLAVKHLNRKIMISIRSDLACPCEKVVWQNMRPDD
jgi:hypothetical protein